MKVEKYVDLIMSLHSSEYSRILLVTVWLWSAGTISNTQRRDIPRSIISFNPYPTAFPYGNGMVLHFYQQQESSTTKTVHKVINKGLKTYV